MIWEYFNYWAVIVLMMTGFYIVITQQHLIIKLVGINLFQVAVFIFFISMGKLHTGTAPIFSAVHTNYSSPLPHVLILTAIVVGIATTALGLALVMRIYRAFGSISEYEILNTEP